MRLGEGQQLVNFTVVAHEDESDDEETEVEMGENVTEATEASVEAIDTETEVKE